MRESNKRSIVDIEVDSFGIVCKLICSCSSKTKGGGNQINKYANKVTQKLLLDNDSPQT